VTKVKKTVIVGVVAVLALAGTAMAGMPPGAVKGKMTLGFIAKYDESGLANKMRWSNVWCTWNKKDEHVIVHVNMKNTSVEHVTAYIYPEYSIAGGGVHGAGFSSIECKGFDAGEFRSLRFSDDPKGVTPFARIAKCMPELQMVKSG
jgi:hypothetical protein